MKNLLSLMIGIVLVSGFTVANAANNASINGIKNGSITQYDNDTYSNFPLPLLPAETDYCQHVHCGKSNTPLFQMVCARHYLLSHPASAGDI